MQASKARRLESRKVLHSLIHEYMDDGDLRQICFELGVSYDDLGDGGHDTKIVELIMMMIREGRQSHFLRVLETHRPGVAWPSEFS